MPFMMPLWPTYLWTAKRGDADELHERLTRKAIEFNAQVLPGDPKAFFDRRKENLFETHRDDDDVRLMGRMFVRACRDYVSVGYEEKRPFRVDITGWVSVQRDGDSTLGLVLADDVLVEFVHDFLRGHGRHGCSGRRIAD